MATHAVSLLLFARVTNDTLAKACAVVLLRRGAVQMQSVEDAQEESGWKLVHGDVFRPPSFSPMLLSIMCGTGMQVLAMTLSTITFAFLGFLSPANRSAMRGSLHSNLLWDISNIIALFSILNNS